MADVHHFDIVSQINLQEVTNAVQQAVKEIHTRYDFKGSQSSVELMKDEIVIVSDDDFRMKAVLEILENKLIKRGVSLKALKRGKQEEAAGGLVRLRLTLQNGLSQEQAKRIVALIKETKWKVQAAIQGDQIRVSAKNIDDLQSVIRLVKEKDFEFAIQFANYR
jgi:hypothetical protein